MTRYLNPTAVRHQGRGVLIAERFQSDPNSGVETRELVYNILALNPDITDDGLGWQGFLQLPDQDARQTSVSGFSVLRVMGVDEFNGPAQVVSDERHIYLFRPDGHTLSVERFLLVEAADPKARDGRGFVLTPDWEVRFRRSGNANLPASADDVSAFRNPDGVPFLDPRRYLSLAPGASKLDLAQGFHVMLLADGDSGKLIWRLFARSTDGTNLLSYSIPRLDDGWFDLGAVKRDDSGLVLPVSNLTLELETEDEPSPMQLTGAIGATLYQRLEPMVSAEGETVQMRTASRVLVACPAVLSPPDNAACEKGETDARLATLDFEVDSAGGTLAFDGGEATQVLVGETGPETLSVDFPLPSSATITSPVAATPKFTLQAWLCPQRGPVAADQAAATRLLLSQSGSVEPAKRGPTLAIVNQFQVRITFGSGEAEVSATTVGNVLTYGVWSNISVTFDGTTIQIYMNGAAVPVTQKGDPGEGPVGEIDRLGAANGGFVGQMTETRIWSRALDGEEIRTSLFEPLPNPTEAEGLAAYWPMDGGTGTTIVDASGKGHDAKMAGTVWTDTTAPLARPNQPIYQLDTPNRGLSAGWLTPTDTYPAFGPVVADARPCALATGDGPIHLYYPAAETRLLTAARLSGTATRAFFSGGWSAADGDATVETGGLVFISRQTGAYNSFTSIDLAAGDDPRVTDATFGGVNTGSGFAAKTLMQFVRSSTTATEIWRGVPRRLGYFDLIIAGRAVADPSDGRIGEGRAIFYDYEGVRKQVLIGLGHPSALAGLRVVGTSTGDYSLATLTGATSDNKLSLSLSVATPLGEPAIVSFGPVTASADAMISLLRGGAADSAYAETKNSTPAWALPAASKDLFVMAPRRKDGNFMVASAVFTLSAGESLYLADFSAGLTLSDDTQLAASWKNAPRDAAAFVAFLSTDPTPEQKAVLDLLTFLDCTEGIALDADSVKVEQQSNLRYATALVAAFREGGDGTLPDSFDLSAEILQGVDGLNVEPDASVSSAVVSMQALTRPKSGYPAGVNLAKTPVGIALASAGRDGGWLADPPRYAEAFNGAGALSVDLTKLVPAPDVYEAPGPVTIESWVQPDPSRRAADRDQDTLQSLLHFSAAENGISYTLGMKPAETPRFFEKVQFAITQPADAEPTDRLVRDNQYTVQIYLRPSLIAPGTCAFWTRTADASEVKEALSIRVLAAQSGGQPQKWRLVLNSADIEMEVPKDLSAGQWTLVTLVRDNSDVAIYLNGELAQSRDDVPPVSIEQNRYTVANPANNDLFEFDPNEFAAWNRPRTAEEIRGSYLMPLTGAEPGLAVLLPLSRKENNYALTNLCRWTTTIYDTQLTNRPFFTNTGLFFDLVGAFGDHAAMSSTPALAPGRWRHATVVLNRRGALALMPGQSAATDGVRESRVGGSFSLDARILLADQSLSRQVVVSRFGNELPQQLYELGVREDGQAYATIRLQAVGNHRLSSDQGLITLLGPHDRRILPGEPHHLAATLALETFNDKRTGRDVTALQGSVYVDGVGGEPVIDPPEDIATQRLVTVIGGSGSGFYSEGETVTITATDPTHFRGWYATVDVADHALFKTTLTMGSGDDFVDITVAANAFVDPVEFNQTNSLTRVGQSGGLGDGPFNGQVSDVRLWGLALDTAAVNELSAQPGASPFDDKLVSWWPFTEQSGRLAKDVIGGNDLTLTDSTLWTWFDAATAAFYIDGQPLPALGMSQPPVSTTPRQMRIGGMVENSAGRFGAGMRGKLDELRLWRGQRTREQILNNQARYLTGAEKGLIGYWRFDTGSGNVVADRTIHRGDARYYDSAGKPATIPWTASSAPVGFDAAIVDDALDTRQSPQVVQLADAATAIAVFEYGDSLPLPDGTLQSVLKRSYVYEGISGLRDDTGYKVGDLERFYIGQVQTDPTVLGYVEGAPPLPSENLTRPLTEPADVDTYKGISAVSLSDQMGQGVNYSSSREDSSTKDFKLSVGAAGAAEKDEVIGIPPIQSAVKSVKFELKLGGVVSATLESSESEEGGLAASADRALTQRLANGGQWERKNPDGEYFLDSGERRFIPGNTGSALVKSRVADLYGLRIPATGALVSLSAEPNPDIPEDINILRFPIDPLYQLAGSLDGRIGLQKAPMTESSYYKPREAYTLKRDVERQRQALAAYFEQTNLQAQLGDGVDISAIARANPLFSPDLETPVRDMVNTYVWSAGAGTYAESEGFSTELSESYSLGNSTEIGKGFNFSIFFTIFGGGVTIEGEAIWSDKVSFSVTKSLSRSRALQMEVEAAPDSFPFKYDENGEMSSEPVPGKVDGYRFMTFFLANRQDNASNLFSSVVDQRWLRTSQDPNAAAMRQAEALSAGTAPWRILHRVTYVSRIPPRFQAVPSLTDKVALPEAPNQDQNAVFLDLVRAKLPPGGASAAEISAAVQVILETDMTALAPWWADFLAAAQVDNSPEQTTYRQILSDSIDYAISVIGVSA
ncbi:LamG-like jellyroll fold domain-containing protein [Microbulbifer sp. TYP-18]|uniref:LamG-like jellyroll fold domain-containing protein n=1 Tax=Microbulbifer sp. TYP-18 TaxID=3230024 RepID=UPI0034C5B790